MPQWNWYGFPDVYFAAQFLVHLVGFAAGGLVLARLVSTAPRHERACQIAPKACGSWRKL